MELTTKAELSQNLKRLIEINPVGPAVPKSRASELSGWHAGSKIWAVVTTCPEFI